MTESSEYIAGFTMALLSLFMTAIFPVFSKIKKVKSTGVNPMVFNIYFSSGVILFCLIATIIMSIVSTEEIAFTWMGLISGILLGLGSWFIWLSLTYMGISHTSSIASGIASFTGFLEGLAVSSIDRIGLAVFALF